MSRYHQLADLLEHIVHTQRPSYLGNSVSLEPNIPLYTLLRANNNGNLHYSQYVDLKRKDAWKSGSSWHDYMMEAKECNFQELGTR